jgi:hypothetical protein
VAKYAPGDLLCNKQYKSIKYKVTSVECYRPSDEVYRLVVERIPFSFGKEFIVAIEFKYYDFMPKMDSAWQRVLNEQ